MIKPAKRAVAVTAFAAAAVVAATGAASAASTGRQGAVVPNAYGAFANIVTTNYVNIRSGPGTGYTAVGQAQTNQQLVDYCFKFGTAVGGDTFWDYIKDLDTGISGYISEYYLLDKSQAKHC
jgi:uncharacterized protein YraI